ncbi:hypothetical protein [Streptomyces siamensis]|uniref:DUF4199 domain-containing protein n=1 Tax=Streptomyces siamensis TaxID=1274986 RepID=A0ABP9JCB5_9ACTN
MNDHIPQGPRPPASTGAGADAGSQAGVIGIGLAAVLTFALAQGSWQWFATFIGVTLLSVIFAFQRRPPWTSALRSAYMRGLIAYALVVGLCVAIALAPMMQRWAWVFPMPGTRIDCTWLGRYEAVRSRATLAGLTGLDRTAAAYAAESKSRDAIAGCLSATTTLWLPLYGAGAAVLVGVGAWFRDRARARKESRPEPSPAEPLHAGTRQDGTR